MKLTRHVLESQLFSQLSEESSIAHKLVSNETDHRICRGLLIEWFDRNRQTSDEWLVELLALQGQDPSHRLFLRRKPSSSRQNAFPQVLLLFEPPKRQKSRFVLEGASGGT